VALRCFTAAHLLHSLQEVEVGTPLLVWLPAGFHDTLHHLRWCGSRDRFVVRLALPGSGYFLTDARTHRGTSAHRRDARRRWDAGCPGSCSACTPHDWKWAAGYAGESRWASTAPGTPTSCSPSLMMPRQGQQKPGRSTVSNLPVQESCIRIAQPKYRSGRPVVAASEPGVEPKMYQGERFTAFPIWSAQSGPERDRRAGVACRRPRRGTRIVASASMGSPYPCCTSSRPSTTACAGGRNGLSGTGPPRDLPVDRRHLYAL